MKIKINREAFLNVFQIAAAVAPARSPKAILQNVKIDVTHEGGVMTATDTEVGVRLTIPIEEVKSAGQAVIPVTRLAMILRESRDEFLHIETNQEKTVIKGQSSRFELQSQNPDEFPEVAEFTDADHFLVSPRVLRELIKRTLFATDSESSRYALGGVLLEMTDNVITAVGTDGRRLAKMEGPIDAVGNPGQGGGTTIVPARSMQLLERILPDRDEPTQLIARPNELLIRDSFGTFFTRLVEGRFPRWRDVVPSRTDSKHIDISVGPMYSALRQAAIVASDESRGIDFTFGNGSLVLSSSTAEVGESRVEMPVAYEEEELTIALDHRFVADFLKVLPLEKTFTFDVQNGDAAAYCYTDDHYGYVIMPMAKERRL